FRRRITVFRKISSRSFGPVSSSIRRRRSCRSLIAVQCICPQEAKVKTRIKQLAVQAVLIIIVAVLFGAVAVGCARSISSAPAAVVSASLASAVPGSSGYHLLKRIPLGGEEGWDYITIDSHTRKLFISRAMKVVVLDVDSGKAAGEIPNTEGVHGIALAPDLNRGFTSNGRANTVTIFNLKTLAVLGTVPTGTNPDAIVYDPASKRVFAM